MTFPPSSWPYAISYIHRMSLNSAVATSGATAVFPGRPYVIRGWLSAGDWSGLTVTVASAEPNAYPVAAGPLFYNESSLVPIVVTPYSAAFEATFVTAGQCIVVTMTGATGQVLNLSVSAITSHE